MRMTMNTKILGFLSIMTTATFLFMPWNRWDDFFLNLTAEFVGILVAILIAEYWIKKTKREEKKKVIATAVRPALQRIAQFLLKDVPLSNFTPARVSEILNAYQKGGMNIVHVSRRDRATLTRALRKQYPAAEKEIGKSLRDLDRALTIYGRSLDPGDVRLINGLLVEFAKIQAKVEPEASKTGDVAEEYLDALLTTMILMVEFKIT